MLISEGACNVASPQTSFGVRLSRIHSVGEKLMRDKRTPKDVCGEATCNGNRKDTSKQAVAALIKIRFAFTGF